MRLMAMEFFSDNSWGCWPPASSPTPPSSTTTITATTTGSPRLSFSRDLSQSDLAPTAAVDHPSDNSLLLLDSPPSDFDFCVTHEKSDQYSSSTADELFSDGILLPLPIQANYPIVPSLSPNNYYHAPPHSPPPPPPPSQHVLDRKDSLKEIMAVTGNDGGKPTAGKPSSFWRFGRSSSLNCGGSGGGFGRRSLICSLPLLPRSKSAGCNPSPTVPKQRQMFDNTSSSSSNSDNSKLFRRAASGNGSAAAKNSYYYGSAKKATGAGGSYYYGNGVRISPVLNVPPPYIRKGSGAVGIFGFGHLLCNGKDKRRKKTPFGSP